MIQPFHPLTIKISENQVLNFVIYSNFFKDYTSFITDLNLINHLKQAIAQELSQTLVRFEIFGENNFFLYNFFIFLINKLSGAPGDHKIIIKIFFVCKILFYGLITRVLYVL